MSGESSPRSVLEIPAETFAMLLREREAQR
jgi:hypothetical protein